MKPTTIIYWTKACLGVVAALISTLLSAVSEQLSLFNGITAALLVYIVTHYVFKSLFLTKVEKPSKIFMTGIGAYFLTWIVSWVILYTLFNYP